MKTYFRCLAAYLTGWVIAQNIYHRWWRAALMANDKVTEHYTDRLSEKVGDEVSEWLSAHLAPYTRLTEAAIEHLESNVGITQDQANALLNFMDTGAWDQGQLDLATRTLRQIAGRS